MAQKLDALTSEIDLVVTSILSTDLTLLRGYSQAKGRAIASFTLLLAEGYASGSISSEQIAEETVELERMVVRFVHNIQALAITTIERRLRGIGNLLIATLSQVTGLPALTLAPSSGMVWGVVPPERRLRPPGVSTGRWRASAPWDRCRTATQDVRSPPPPTARRR
jgi:hypothetical protein